MALPCRRRYVVSVEETDRKIVSLLARNGRMSFTELARQAGLSVSAVHQRVRRLEQEGVIKGYVAVFDPDDVGLPLTAFVSIKPFDAAAPDDLPARLEHLTAIEACHSAAGRHYRGGTAVAAHRVRDVLRRRGHHGGAAHQGEVEQRGVGRPGAAGRSGD